MPVIKKSPIVNTKITTKATIARVETIGGKDNTANIVVKAHHNTAPITMRIIKEINLSR